MLFPLLSLSIVPAYRIVDLGVPATVGETAYDEAVAINDRGEILVRSGQRAFLWRKGEFIDLGAPKPSRIEGEPRAEPTALNDHSVVVGTQGTGSPVFMSGLTDVEPYIWKGKGLDDLGAGWAAIPESINNLGDIAGRGIHRGFVRLRGKIWNLGTLSHVSAGNDSSAVAVNDRRQILGTSTYGGHPKEVNYSLPVRPFLIDGNRLPLRMKPLPLPPGFSSASGEALNNRGTILAVAGKGDRVVPYLIRKGKITPLGIERGCYLASGGLNVHDDLVGVIRHRDDERKRTPVLWREGKRVVLPNFAGWTIQTTAGINDKGQICGTGLHDGKLRFFLLMPR